jgi:superfamily II DNA or RNA helicase
MITFGFEKGKIRMQGELFSDIREHFSVKDDTARFRKGRAKYFASRLYCITPTGLFEPGLFYDIMRFIKEKYPNEEIRIDKLIASVVKPGLTGARVYDNLTHSLRDYQYAACENAIKHGRGILKMGTGAGKTLTICSILMSAFLQRKDSFKCLVIVPDLTLVNQTFSDFEDYSALFKFTRWTGKIKPDLTANVIIANLGILQSQFKNNEWLQDVDMLIIDECHKLKKNNKINKMVQSIKTVHKFGLTGTLPDTKPDEWNIIGKIGSIIYEKDSYSLRTEQHLTTAKASILKIGYKTKPKQIKNENPYKTELDFLYENEFRNNIIYRVCTNFNNNILILINHIIHGDELFNKLKSIPGKQVYFIRGDVDVEERDRIKQLMEVNTDVICIAISAIFSTGVNIKNIHMIVFGAGGKSSIRTIQSIGRGLRLHKNKDKLTIIDLADNLKYGKRHVEKRIEIYNNEKIPFSITDIVEK